MKYFDNYLMDFYEVLDDHYGDPLTRHLATSSKPVTPLH